MAKKKKKEILLWGDITEGDFLNESDNIIDVDTQEYNRQQMIGYMQNVNLMRHFPRIGDSLKPVERRAIYTLYTDKSFPGTKPKKSNVIVGDVMTLHPHGDSSIYGTIVGLAQVFKNPVPLVQDYSNFGNDEKPDGYAHMRYTEMTMSKYGLDCFFSDYDDDCIEKIFNTAKDEMEPLMLPSKYPNILVNGGFGVSIGHSFCIPTYNITDIIKMMKGLLHDPDYKDIYIMPDIPTGCDIVDNGTLREICDTGNGVLKMRSTITIEEDPKKPNIWILRVHNLPWMTGLDAVMNSLMKLTKDGILPIKDVHNYTYQVVAKDPNGGTRIKKQIRLDIIINRAHDPNQIKEKLYKRTPLQKPISVNFKVVTDALEIDRLNMRDLGLIWIDVRREYLRRRVNKKIAKLSAQISLLEILVFLTDKNNLEKTIKIIKNNTSDQAVKALMNWDEVNINSYQAEKIVDSKLRAFTKEAHAKYKKEMIETKQELKKYQNMTKSTKIIDEIIESQLEELEKYNVDGRKSRIISEKTEKVIPNTDHFVLITKTGLVKKLPYDESVLSKRKTPGFGIFKTHDYPICGTNINNLDSLMVFDNFGMYTCIPVHEIENTEPSQYGTRIYDSMRLNGEVVRLFPFISKDLESFVKETLGDIFVVTLTKNGYLKKTPIEEFTGRRNQKNVKAMRIREDDEMVDGKIIIERKGTGTNLMIYTEQGEFAYIHSSNIANQSKDSSGLLSIKLDPNKNDACKGMVVIGDDDQYILVVTENGCMKRCEIDYLPEPGKRKMSSYLTKLDPEDKVKFVDAVEENIQVIVCTRSKFNSYNGEDIPIKGRKLKCSKMIPVQRGDNIIYVAIKTLN